MKARPVTVGGLAADIAARIEPGPRDPGRRRRRARPPRRDVLADRIVEPLHADGGYAVHIPAGGFLRPASLRLERGRTNPDAYYEDWLGPAARSPVRSSARRGRRHRPGPAVAVGPRHRPGHPRRLPGPAGRWGRRRVRARCCSAPASTSTSPCTWRRPPAALARRTPRNVAVDIAGVPAVRRGGDCRRTSPTSSSAPTTPATPRSCCDPPSVFLPGLQLCGVFYRDAVRPLLDERVSGAAARRRPIGRRLGGPRLRQSPLHRPRLGAAAHPVPRPRRPRPARRPASTRCCGSGCRNTSWAGRRISRPRTHGSG